MGAYLIHENGKEDAQHHHDGDEMVLDGLWQ